MFSVFCFSALTCRLPHKDFLGHQLDHACAAGVGVLRRARFSADAFRTDEKRSAHGRRAGGGDEPLDLNGRPVRVTLSAGVATARGRGVVSGQARGPEPRHDGGRPRLCENARSNIPVGPTERRVRPAHHKIDNPVRGTHPTRVGVGDFFVVRKNFRVFTQPRPYPVALPSGGARLVRHAKGGRRSPFFSSSRASSPRAARPKIRQMNVKKRQSKL